MRNDSPRFSRVCPDHTSLSTTRENAPSPTRSKDSPYWLLANSNAPLRPGIISKRLHLCSVPTSKFLTYSTKNERERGKKASVLERIGSAKWKSLRNKSRQHKRRVERTKGNLITLLNPQSTLSSSHLGDQTPSSFPATRGPLMNFRTTTGGTPRTPRRYCSGTHRAPNSHPTFGKTSSQTHWLQPDLQPDLSPC